ncbi:hypothetical protein [Oerskovia paurometabola]|uniref:Inorganic polyphosphate/ATP-NAD kinase n=1 Tax=Oerskovia paurometabola TaxID=162170 RepID=A0ABW1X6D4_9CELL|nr:hypothetical protein [Oerskovia paurometabola]MBM7495679.1 hypothetical protein [Oerskovia paurometabola]
MPLQRRVVVVHRRTELDELLDRHATRGQAEFFLRTRGRTLAAVQERHDAVAEARARVVAAIPEGWRRADVERADLGRFLVAPEDVVVVVGQDGLVANVAKYLTDQPVLGVDPEPGTNAGALVRLDVTTAVRLLARAGRTASAPAGPGPSSLRPDGAAPLGGLGWRTEDLTTVVAHLDDGQHLSALNEVFVGHPSHQSARYRIAADGAGGSQGPAVGRGRERGSVRVERQSSSGVIVATGAGATGWCASIARERGGRRLPGPTDPLLAWFVREAWPSPATGADLTEGMLDAGGELRLTVESDQLVVFGDGVESDRLVATWGQEVTVRVGENRLRLVVG